MPSPPILDLEEVLAPIPGDDPVGTSVRYAGPYDAIQEARREDDTLEKGDWRRETKVADWLGVIAVATETLTTKCKDLQVAVWLTEALVKRHGFPGLRDALRLIRALQERFWDGLYPQIEDGDLEPRTAPLDWLNQRLPLSIRSIPLTRSHSGDQYSWLQWDESRTVENLGRQNPEAKAQALAEGKLGGEQFDKAVKTTPRAVYEVLAEDLAECREEYDGLATVVDGKCGRDAPSLLNVKKAIEDCRAVVEDLLRKKREQEPGPTPTHPQAPREEVARDAARSGVPYAGGEAVPFAPRDRADALGRLAAVAEFFRRTEPHSPVSYLVQRAVHWGEMPLEEWLREVIKEGSALQHVWETLGLKPPGSDAGGGEQGG